MCSLRCAGFFFSGVACCTGSCQCARGKVSVGVAFLWCLVNGYLGRCGFGCVMKWYASDWCGIGWSLNGVFGLEGHAAEMCNG